MALEFLVIGENLKFGTDQSVVCCETTLFTKFTKCETRDLIGLFVGISQS